MLSSMPSNGVRYDSTRIGASVVFSSTRSSAIASSAVKLLFELSSEAATSPPAEGAPGVKQPANATTAATTTTNFDIPASYRNRVHHFNQILMTERALAPVGAAADAYSARKLDRLTSPAP